MLRFELSEAMVRTIAEVLSNAPYRVSAPILEELQKQINAQQPQRDKEMKDGLAA